MPFDPYRRVLALPHVRRLVLVGVVARIPHTAAALVLTMHVVLTLDRGYAAAGVVAASVTIGLALGAPWRGRAIDRMGLRRALLPSIVAEAVVWTSAPFLSYHQLIGAVFVGGLLGLPVFTVVRQSMSVLVPAEQHRTAFALDSVAVELSFMVGPALGVLVATQVSTQVALVCVGATTVLAGGALYALDAPTRSPADPRAARVVRVQGEAPPKAARVPLSGGLVAVLGATAASTIVLAGTDVSILASMDESGAVGLTGVVVGAWCVASLVGGLVYGALPRALPPLVLLFGLGALTAPVGLVTGPLALGLAVIPAGLLCAPVITATSEVIVKLVPEAVRGEAMGWHGSALTGGSAVGAPLAGWAIDQVGPWGGFAAVGLTGVLLSLVALLVTLLRRRRRRRTRGWEQPDPVSVRSSSVQATAVQATSLEATSPQATRPVSFSPGP
ncbi:MAG TPA: MFS transporter [Actinomycetales bacterium]